MTFSQDEIDLIVTTLQEKYDSLDKELPDPSMAAPADIQKARKILMLGGLIRRFKPVHCGLHDHAEPCPRCEIYAPRVPR